MGRARTMAEKPENETMAEERRGRVERRVRRERHPIVRAEIRVKPKNWRPSLGGRLAGVAALVPVNFTVTATAQEAPAIGRSSAASRPTVTVPAGKLFVLGDIVTSQPECREIHVIADNLSAHKTDKVNHFLANHPNVHMHFTPTYSSWLNQVELWFAKIQRDVIARGVFTSVKDLEKKLMRYIRLYNNHPKP